VSPAKSAAVTAAISTAVDRAAASGWRLATPDRVQAPGLMTGVAGIGYALLHLAAPAEVSSVLALRLDLPARVKSRGRGGRTGR
jgi:lantibiotic modifying enzyme